MSMLLQNMILIRKVYSEGSFFATEKNAETGYTRPCSNIISEYKHEEEDSTKETKDFYC